MPHLEVAKRVNARWQYSSVTNCIGSIQSLEKHLSGVKMGRRRTKTAVTAYADNVTIYLTQVEDMPKMEEILQRYESASGAKINKQKCRAMAIGIWDTTISIMDIPYHKEIKILGFHFSNSVNSTDAESWSSVIVCVRATAQTVCCRDLATAQTVCCRNLALDKRIAFLHDYLLAKIRYVSQIFPTPPDKIRQINTTIAWFIWKGKIFRVPLSTLQQGETGGGWNLVTAEAQCRALYMCRIVP